MTPAATKAFADFQRASVLSLQLEIEFHRACEADHRHKQRLAKRQLEVLRGEIASDAAWADYLNSSGTETDLHRRLWKSLEEALGLLRASALDAAKAAGTAARKRTAAYDRLEKAWAAQTKAREAFLAQMPAVAP